MIIAKFNKTDKIILSVSALIILFYSYLLYDDSFLFIEESSSNQQIGILSQSENDVRRKSIESFLWTPARKELLLREKDSIFTGEGSHAEVTLKDGSAIKLEENSLVTLTLKEGELELNLKYGEIKTELKEIAKLQIKSDDENITIQNDKKTRSKASIRKRSTGPAKVDVLDGAISLSSKNKTEKVLLTKSETLNINSSGEIKKARPAKINLLTPNDSKITLLNSKQGFYLNWNGENTHNEVLFISKDSQFSNILMTKNQISPKVLIQDLDKGSYYWKIEAADDSNKKLSSSVQSFEVIVFNTPTINSPENNATLTFNTKENLKNWFTPIKIEWISSFSTNEIQLSTEPTFTKPFENKKLTSNQFLNNFRPGTYYARIRGHYNNSASSWSPINKFTVAATQIKEEPIKVELKAPSLLTKKIKLDLQNSRAPASIEPAKMKWTKVTGAIKYLVEVDDSNSFNSPAKFESKSVEYNFTPVNHLKYFYRVKAVGQNKVTSSYSDIGEVNISLKKPTLEKVDSIMFKSSKVDEKPPSMEFSLQWTHVPLAKKYTIEYSDTASFSQVNKIDSTSNKSKVSVPKPGKYHFRVLASINNDTPVTPPSNIESALYEFKKKLPPPNLGEPRNKMTVFLQQEIEPFIWINWEKDSIATKYEFQVSTDSKFKKTLISKVQQDNKFLIKEKLPLGKIYWRVRSLTEDQALTSDWSSKREFILLHNKNNENFE